jgi:hypothetical protein
MIQMPQFQWLDDDQRTQDWMLEGMAESVEEVFDQVRALEGGLPLLGFLAAHAHSLQTSDDIAYHLNQAPAAVAHASQSLMALGLARQVDVRDLTFFSLMADPERGRLVRELVAWQALWTTRQARIERVINGPALTRGKSPIVEWSHKASPTDTSRLW